jgi:hypothetical protein
LRFLNNQMFPALFRQPIVLEFPAAVGGLPIYPSPSPFSLAGATRDKATHVAFAGNHLWFAEYACQSDDREPERTKGLLCGFCHGRPATLDGK